MRTAWRSFVLPGLFALLLLGLMPMITLGQAPPGPAIRQQQRTEGLPVTGPMEMVTFVFEFAPGAQTPPHTHQGRVLATVLEGEVTVRTEGGEQTYKQGESWVETPTTHTAVNTASGKTHVMVSILTPKGAPLSQVQPGGPSPAPPAPATLHLTRTETLVPAAPYEVAQTVFDVAPGGQFPPHTHPGQVFVTVLDGAMTLRTQGTEQTYQVGESFRESPDMVYQATNAGSVPATVLVTSLLPKGAPLSTPAAARPGMPRTGAGGMALPALPAWAALLLSAGFLVGGWGAWRARRGR